MAYWYSFEKIWEKIAWTAGACTLLGFSFGYAIAGMGWWWFLIAIVVVGASIRLIFIWAIEAGNHIRGMQGELRVDAMLTTLPSDDYYHENDVVLGEGRGNIDHVVVGPNGIWTIETKNRVGDVRVTKGRLKRGGWDYPTKELLQAKGQGASLREYLDAHGCHVPWVQPIICVANIEAEVEVEGLVEGVVIVDYRNVAELVKTKLSGRPLAIDERQKIRNALLELREKLEAREENIERKKTWRLWMLIVIALIWIYSAWHLNMVQRKKVSGVSSATEQVK